MSYPSLFVRFLFCVFVLTAGLPWAAPGVALAGGPPQLELPKGKECVKSADWMRRNHMDFLKESRELAVREGVRVKSDSLKNCATCHTSREKFCDRCHTYAGVAPNCFECHHYPK